MVELWSLRDEGSVMDVVASLVMLLYVVDSHAYLREGRYISLSTRVDSITVFYSS